MPRRSLTRLLSAGSAVVAAGAICAVPAPADGGSGLTGRIVFAANRAPLFNGEIYRVNPDGRRVDLSNSASLDLYPSVSPDGRRVAFLSTRGGHVAVYVVATAGGSSKRVSPLLFTETPHDGLSAQFAWTRDSRRLAAAVGGSNRGESGVFVANLHGGWRTVARTAGAEGLAWSRDGRLLAYTTVANATVHVVGSSGVRLWNEIGLGDGGWSASGRLAVLSNSYTIRIYDEHAHRLAALPGQSLAWSPDGDVAAVMDGKRLSLRRGGGGKPYLDVRIPRATPGAGSNGVAWVGSGKVRISGGEGWVGYDVAHKRPWMLPAAATEYPSVVSPGGSVALPNGRTSSARENALVLLPAGAALSRVLQTDTWCGDELPFSSLQFVPKTQALVYQSACAEPSADLYAINADGTGLGQLTDTPTDETQPSLSPDGSSVVYVQQQVAERCDGCPQTIWRVSSNGGTPLALTHHTVNDATPFDTNPSWSPDGRLIAFLRGGLEGPSTLTTLPAGGGDAKSLKLGGYQPVWGPQQIALLAPVSKLTVETVDPASGAARTVATGRVGVDGGPLAWSPDGRLAYLSYDARGRASIVVVGSSTRPLALSPLLLPGSTLGGLASSPDGSRFAVEATSPDGVGDVYTLRVDGTGLTRLTTGIGAVGQLSWR